MGRTFSNYNYYHGAVGESSPLTYYSPYLHFICGCGNNKELIDKINELEKKLAEGLTIDTTELEKELLSKITETVEEATADLTETVESLTEVVSDNTETLNEMKCQVNHIEHDVHSIYDDLFDDCCHHHHHHHCCNENCMQTNKISMCSLYDK